MPSRGFLAVLLVIVCFLAACGGGNTLGGGASITSVSVSPTSANLLTQATQQFSAAVTGTGAFSTQVSWAVNSVRGGNSTVGTISSDGLYTAPAVPPSPNLLTITAASTQDTTKTGNATAAVSNPAPTLSALSPTSSDQGRGALTITVSGSGFNATTSATVAGNPRSSTLVDGGHLKIVLLAADMANPASLAVAVSNPQPGGGTSTSSQFSVLYVPGSNGGVNYTAGRDAHIGGQGCCTTIADFNEDGIPDVATVHFIFDIDNPTPRDELHVEHGDGNGSFRTNQVFKTGSGPIGLIAGDFNNDGHIDLISANTPIEAVSGPSTLSVFLGDGKGNFARTDIDLSFAPVGPIDAGLIAADFNKDGDLDLAVAGSNQTFVFLGNGDGTFRAGVTLNLAGSMSVGDFNEDGNIDLVTNAGGASIFFGNGDGTFSGPQSVGAGTPENVVASDLDGDGHLDLVLPIPNFPLGTLCVAWGDGTGKFTLQTVTVPNASDFTIAVADIDLNGLQDIVFSATGILYQTSNRTFTLDTSVTDFGVNATTADLNNDGMPDVVGYEQGNIRAYLGRGPNGLLHSHVTPLSLNAKAVAAGDFNGDGKLDVAVAYATNVTIMTGDGTGNFATGASYGNFPDSVWGIAAGNFAGGNTPYLAVGAADLIIYQGDGKGNFTQFFTVPQVAPGSSGAVGKIGVKDLNGDGKLDLVLAGAGPNVVVLLGDGAGHFTVASQIALAATSVTVGDFNGDGIPDLALSDYGNVIWPYFGDGTGNFTPGVSAPAGSAPLDIDAADFNHDGKLDVAIADFLFGSLLTMPTTSLVVFGDGDGNFPSNLALNAGNQTNKVSAVDVNSDGWADIVLMNDGSNDFDVFLNDQTGSFQVPYGFGVGTTPATFQIADVDGDGRPDLITVTFAGIEVTLNRTTNLAPGSNSSLSHRITAKEIVRARFSRFGGRKSF
jgi:hypothetical protein